MFLIGLTGGIGSGKTSVSSFLRERGIAIIDADLLARKVVEPNTKCWKLIREHFGPGAINEDDNQINRQYIAQIIFNDPEKRLLLNRITHPEIQRQTFFKLLFYFLTFQPFVVMDIPLLFESSIFKSYMSYVIVVKCTPEQQLERIKRRNGYSDEEAQRRINSQMPIEEKVRLADIVIDNSGDIESTIAQTREVFLGLNFPLTFWLLRFAVITIYTLPLIAILKYLKF